MMLGEIDTSNEFFLQRVYPLEMTGRCRSGKGRRRRAAAVTIVASELIGRHREKAQSRYKDGPGIPIVIVPSGL
jgi:hypothetical protein